MCYYLHIYCFCLLKRGPTSFVSEWGERRHKSPQCWQSQQSMRSCCRTRASKPNISVCYLRSAWVIWFHALRGFYQLRKAYDHQWLAVAKIISNLLVAIDCIAGVREADNSIKPSLLELNTIRRLSNDERQFSIATNIIFELFLNIFVGIRDAVFMLPKISLRYYISKNIYVYFCDPRRGRIYTK